VLTGYRFQMQHVYCLMAGCAVDLYRGAPEAALARLDSQRAAMRASLFERVQSIRVTMTSLRGRAHLALAARRTDGIREHLAVAERCARRLGEEGLPGAAAHGQLLRAAIGFLSGDAPSAVSRLREAIAGFDERRMALHAAAARHSLARLVGGDEGGELERAALVPLREQHVVSPERFIEHYAPGFTG
jgi:hypothetical protein